MQQALLRRQAQRRHTQPVAAMGDFSTAAPTCRLRSADVQDSDAQGNTRPIGENLALGEDAPCMDEHMPAGMPEHRTIAAQPRSLLSQLDTIPRADSNLSAGDGQHLNVFGNHQPEQHEAAAASDYAEGGGGGAAGTNMQPPDDLAGAGKQHHVDAGWRSEALLSTSERSRPARAATDMTADVSAASAPFPEQARSPHTATEEDAMADASHVESLDQQEDHDGHEDWFAGEDEAMHVWGSDHDAAAAPSGARRAVIGLLSKSCCLCRACVHKSVQVRPSAAGAAWVAWCRSSWKIDLLHMHASHAGAMKVASVVWSRDQMCSKCNKNMQEPAQVRRREGKTVMRTWMLCGSPRSSACRRQRLHTVSAINKVHRFAPCSRLCAKGLSLRMCAEADA